jgi:uncharacterized cupredoxin-like copper-binding protein
MNKPVITALLVLPLAACASSQNATGNTTYTRVGQGVQVQVLLDEYKIHMPTRIPSGEVTFNVKNTGSHTHCIEINGEGLDAKLIEDLKPGESADLHVTLAPGIYRVWCPVGPHAAMGMRLDLTVTLPPAAEPTAPAP